MDAKISPRRLQPRHDLEAEGILSQAEASVLSKLCSGEPLELTDAEKAAALRMDALSQPEMLALVAYFRTVQNESLS